MKALIGICIISAFFVCSCATDEGYNTHKGAVIGAIGGALAGQALGGGHTGSTLIGAAAGALTGAVVGQFQTYTCALRSDF